MNKTELEQLLLTQEGRQILADRAAYIQERYGMHGSTGGLATEELHPLESPFASKPTADEVAVNDDDFAVRSDLASDLSRFIHDHEGADPMALVKVLIGRVHEDPNAANLMFLESAVNELASRRECTRDLERFINEACQTLLNADKPAQRADQGAE